MDLLRYHPAHQTDRVLAASLPAANLVRAQKMGLDIVLPAQRVTAC